MIEREGVREREREKIRECKIEAEEEKWNDWWGSLNEDRASGQIKFF